jgi:hypothetical protein
LAAPLRYLRPSHHPNDEGDTQMAIDYLEYSPAAKAARERAGARQRPQGAEMTSGQQVADTKEVAAQ